MDQVDERKRGAVSRRKQSNSTIFFSRRKVRAHRTFSAKKKKKRETKKKAKKFCKPAPSFIMESIVDDDKQIQAEEETIVRLAFTPRKSPPPLVLF
jgi:hypothetical protein